jgi:chitinase
MYLAARKLDVQELEGAAMIVEMPTNTPRLPPRGRSLLPVTFAALAALAASLVPGALAAAPKKPAAPPPPVLSVADVTIAEGDAGVTPAVFVLSLSRPVATRVTVEYATRDGSALVGAGDYQRTSGVLSIDPRVTSATIEVPVRGDAVEEPDETFVLLLRHPQGARLAVEQATAEIVDDDGAAGPGPEASLSIGDARVTEGDGGRRDAHFTARLSSRLRRPVSVAFSTADGSAEAGSDYEAASGTLRLPPGATSASFAVTVLGDTADEGDEDFTVTLTDPVGAELAATTARGLILDDDAPGSLSLQPVGSPARRALVGQMVVLQVRVTGGAGEPVAGATVQWTLDGAGELLDGASTTSDGSGIASQRLRLGSGPGRVAVRATDVETNETALFHVTVNVG